jgi:hypothetical protein
MSAIGLWCNDLGTRAVLGEQKEPSGRKPNGNHHREEPTNMRPAARILHRMRLYAQPNVEIIHGHLARAAHRPSNLDDIREF